MENKELEYIEHLEELRWKIIRVLVFFVIAFILSFIFIEKITLLIQEPIRDLQISLYYFKPYEKFATYIRMAFFTGLIISIPYAVFQISSFIFPALHKEEKKYIWIVIFVVPIIFFAGSYFSYKFISPFAFRFFLNFSNGDNVVPMWSFGEYNTMLLGIMFATGLLFQFPIILLMLMKIGIVDVKIVSRLRGYIVLGILVISAILSPPDIVSQILISIPLYLLFEMTIVIGSLINKK